MEKLKGVLSFMLSPLVRGSSTVFRRNSYAFKVSTPRLFVRLLYLIFYGTTKSPYETETGIRRAVLLRSVANHVTNFRMGRGVFASPISYCYEELSGYWRPTLIMTWINGQQVSPEVGRKFAGKLTEVLLRAGLPTWSVLKPNTHLDMRLVDGNIVCLDFESVLPNVFVPREELAAAAKSGKLFHLDPVNLGRLKLELFEAEQRNYENIADFRHQVRLLDSIDYEFHDWRRS